VIFANCLPLDVDTHRQADPSVATPERSGLSAIKLTDVDDAKLAPVPVSAVAGPAPLAAVSEPVNELKRILGSGTG